MVKPDKYVDAIKIFSEIALKYLKVPLLKSSAKDLAFKAGLLYLSLEVSLKRMRLEHRNLLILLRKRILILMVQRRTSY